MMRKVKFLIAIENLFLSRLQNLKFGYQTKKITSPVMGILFHDSMTVSLTCLTLIESHRLE